jgi:hypothetical protein
MAESFTMAGNHASWARFDRFVLLVLFTVDAMKHPYFRPLPKEVYNLDERV